MAPSRRRVDGYALLALGLTLFAWAALLSANYFMNAHDAHHSVFFPLQFDRGIRDGYWLPRWTSDVAHGYGYPLLVFYAPLSFYIWEAVFATGLVGVVASTKVTFILGFILAAAGMYAYARDIWDRRAALLASVVYTYLPYHLVNIYVRAALAEFMALSLLPWIALAFRRLIQRPSLRGVAAAAAGYGALLWMHNITALLFTPLLAALILFELAPHLFRRAQLRASLVSLLRNRLLPIGLSIALGVALGTAVWLPGLTEQGDIKIEQWSLQTYQYRDHFVYPSQLFSPAWGFGFSVPGIADDMSFQLGTVALLLALIGGYGLLPARTVPSDAPLDPARRFSAKRAMFVFYAVSLLILVGLMLPPAIAIWNLTRLATLIQFPWRLLGVSGFCLAVLAGNAATVMGADSKGSIAPGLAIAIVAVLVSSSAYAIPEMTPPNARDETQQTWRDYERDHPDMVGMVAQTQEQPTGSPMLAALEANQTPLRFQSESDGVTIRQLYSGGGSASARVQATRPATVRFLTYWYPGWLATLDGTPISIQQDGGNLGLMTVEIPTGEHTLAFRFTDTPQRGAANLVTLVSLLIVLVLVAAGGRRRELDT